ncbi:SubName: Full=Uncharacterized protein {ECO:0000313/EMBL:CCA68210.1} [Serendipita indica DSM 11827]|uniref:F-box domain-containing protein n=1 Tax=Serendipita indica (strain DSM 11827) TaxID=1109443 RepID=G4TAA2_SERID|nr:SubName: Full=Uncharacterized protein {ECO:0000313/EMBL:CCA68210.1} [Serendipita indica DSM 11827]CCA68210.1 hypothetical protein PIIN_02076 [Serendipita indica DSM 11827]
MGSQELRLDNLPESIVLEICTYLDLAALVALAQVNRAMRVLSRSTTSFWAAALYQCGLVIPLTEQRPVETFEPVELAQAAHRMTYREANFQSPVPQLRGWKKIRWPFEPLNASVAEAVKHNTETPEGALYTHLIHEYAEWAFFISSLNILRTVHLGSGKLSLIWERDKYHKTEEGARIAWAIDLIGSSEGLMVMNCILRREKGNTYGIRLLKFNLDIKSGEVGIKELGSYVTGGSATHLDISRRYIFFVVALPGAQHDNVGEISMVRLKDLHYLQLPSIYPSIELSIAEEYFISVGISPNQQIWVQIAGLPSPDVEPKDSTMLDSLEWLPVHSYLLPIGGDDLDQMTCRIAHWYIGSKGTVNVWAYLPSDGTRSTFTLEFDIDALRRLTKRYLTGRYTDEEPMRKLFVVEKDAFRAVEETTKSFVVTPSLSGKRFIWWKRVDNPFPNDDNPLYIVEMDSPVDVGEGERETFQLYLSMVEELAPASQTTTDVDEEELKVDRSKHYDNGSATSIRLKTEKRLQIPRGLACRVPDIQLLLIFEWSGTVLVQLVSGDIWVLQYGKH